MRHRAFTLPELLVVIVIIAILLSIALPWLAGARESARRVKCLTNLHALATAVEKYRSESGEVLPWATRPLGILVGDLSPVQELAPYVYSKMPEIENGEVRSGPPWKCPSDRLVALETGWSYAYFPIDLMNYFEFRVPRPARQATLYFETRPHVPIIGEVESFHSARPNRSSRLVVGLDGAARQGG